VTDEEMAAHLRSQGWAVTPPETIELQRLARKAVEGDDDARRAYLEALNTRFGEYNPHLSG